MRIGADLVDHGESDDNVIIVASPYDAGTVGRVPRGSTDDIDAAVAWAKARRIEGPVSAFERAAILDRAAEHLSRHAVSEQFARRIAGEAGKPLKAARVEVARAADTFRFAAGVARSLTGETIALDAGSAGAGSGKLGFVIRVPIGVVAAISPFNFPLNLVVHKVAPAIAAGCPVVLKPASTTPLTALALADLLITECGLDPGDLSVVTCSGATAEHLVAHDDVDYISFTGSPEVGWSIRAAAPRKKVGLELGNNSPVIIEGDADLTTAAAKVAAAGFAYSGQTCISVQRVYVNEAVFDSFLGELLPVVEALKSGDPLDESTDVSVLITRSETDRVLAAIEAAVDAGAEIQCGGSLSHDGVLLPTVLTNVAPEMDVCATEIFGPVITISRYSDFGEALRLANATRYGLQAGVFTADLAKALEAARSLEFGGVLINEVPSWRADQMPYGGIKDSGNTREGPAYAAFEMTEPRMVVIAPPG